MNRTRIILGLVFGLVASSALIQQLTFAQSTPQATAASQYAVYLPLLTSAGVVPVPQPEPVPVAVPGFFPLTDYLTYNAATAIDAQGGMHLTFYVSDERQQEKLGQPALYTSCTAGMAACADPKNWSDLVQLDSGVNEVQIVVTSTGKPRLLVRRNGSTGYDYDYWACEQQCANGQNWNGVLVTQAAGVERNNADMPQPSFTLDAQGRPRIALYEAAGIDINVGGKLFYGWCDSGCAGNGPAFQIVQVASAPGSIPEGINHPHPQLLLRLPARRGALDILRTFYAPLPLWERGWG